jgi:hypothetical protein
MNENRIEEFDMDAALNYCFRFVSSSAKTWERIQYPFKLRFQKNIFPEKIAFDGKKFGNTKLAKIYALNQTYDGKKSHLVHHCGDTWNQIMKELAEWRAIQMATIACSA